MGGIVRELYLYMDKRYNYVYGIRTTSKTNSNSIYLPASGYCFDNSYSKYIIGYYWNSSIDVDNPNRSWIKRIDTNKVSENSRKRYLGYSIRPVYAE